MLRGDVLARSPIVAARCDRVKLTRGLFASAREICVDTALIEPRSRIVRCADGEIINRLAFGRAIERVGRASDGVKPSCRQTSVDSAATRAFERIIEIKFRRRGDARAILILSAG